MRGFPAALLLLWLALFSASPAGAQQPTAEPLLSPGTPLRVALYAPYPPFSVVGPGGRVHGALVDLWQMWSKTTGTPIRFVIGDWPTTLDALRNGQADVHAGLFADQARAQWLSFSEPIHRIRTAVYYPAERPDHPPLSALPDGTRVGVIERSVQQSHIAEIQPGLVIQTFPDGAAAFLALLEGDIDALVNEVPTVEADLDRHGLHGAIQRAPDDLLSNTLHVGVPKTRPQLLAHVNAGLAAIPQADLEAIDARWVRHAEDRFYLGEQGAATLNATEKAWLARHPVIRFAVTNFIEPIDIVGDDGSYTGLNADLIARLNAEVGTNIVPEFYSQWQQVVDAALAGEVDGVLSFSRTPEREAYILYTPPYAHDPVVAITRDDTTDIGRLEDLQGRTVGAVKGFAVIDNVRPDIADGTLRLFDSNAAGLEALARGQIDAHITTLINFVDTQGTDYRPGLKVAASRVLEGGALRIGIHNSQPVLHDIVSKALAAIPPAELAALRAKWLTPPQPSASTAFDPTFLLVVAGLTAGFALLLLALGRALRNRDLSAFFGAASFRVGVLVGLSVLVAVVVGMNLIALSESRTRTRAEINQKLQVVLNGSVDQVLSWANRHKTELQQIARDADLVSLTGVVVRSKAPASTLDTLVRDHIMASERYDHPDYFLITPQRTLIGDQGDAGALETHAGLIDQAFAGETVFLPPSPIQRPLAAGGAGLVMYFATPILDSRGRPLAVLAERLSPSTHLTEALRHGRVGASGETYAVSAQQIMVSQGRFANQLVDVGLLSAGGSSVGLPIRDPGANLIAGGSASGPPEDWPPTTMMRDALRLRTEGKDRAAGGQDVAFSYPTNLTGYRDYRGVPVVGAWTWLPDLDLGLATELDVEEAYAAHGAFRFNLVLISAVTTLLAVATTLFTLLVGQRAHRTMSRARDDLETRVRARTEELAEQTDLLEAVLVSIHQGLVAYDRDLTLIVANERMGEVRGMPAELRMPGARFEDWVRHDIAHGEFGDCDVEETVAFLVERAKTSQVHQFERPRPDGAIISVAGGPLPSGGFVSTFTDVTETRRAQEALAQSEERTRLLLESVGEGVFGVDREGRVTFVNPPAERLLGYTAEEMIGHSAHHLFHHHRPDGSPYPLEESWMYKSFTFGESNRIDDEVLWRKDGSPLEIEYNSTPIRKGDSVVGAVISFNDISLRREAERKRAEAHAIAQQALDEMNAVMAAIDYGICFMDADLRARMINHAFARMWGIEQSLIESRPTMADLLGHNRHNGLYNVDDAQFEAYVADRVAAVRQGAVPPTEMVRADGRALIYQCLALPDGGRMLTYYDITDRKQAEQKLEDAYEVIRGSITYASRIQRAVLPDTDMIRGALADFFVLWEPRDLVGGDIYWCDVWGDGLLMILADCTGHGVPGAFVTLLATGALNKAKAESFSGDLPGLITAFHNTLQETLGQHRHDGGSDDGLELGACYLTPDMTRLHFVGARFDLFVVEDGAVETFKGTRQGIAYRRVPRDPLFDLHEVPLNGRQSFYLSSDGLIDQVGGERRRGFGKKRFKELLLDIQGLPFEEQKERLLAALIAYQGGENRRDDVSVIGFRVG
ncbi:PAS-domain containing protein [Roseospirillum parvum]|uniref:PAS-domain containing protein n=1 Tax=Roseospirillum parvum TaxID=83401 RepID=UPI00159FFDDD|nr:transporter substrate-binding domain-containing protein [Roseospirillum parvum]